MCHLVEQDADLMVPGVASVALDPAIVVLRVADADRTGSVIFVLLIPGLGTIEGLGPLALSRNSIGNLLKLDWLDTGGKEVLVIVTHAEVSSLVLEGSSNLDCAVLGSLWCASHALWVVNQRNDDVVFVHQFLDSSAQIFGGASALVVSLQKLQELLLPRGGQRNAQLLHCELKVGTGFLGLSHGLVAVSRLVLPAANLGNTTLGPPFHQTLLLVGRFGHLSPHAGGRSGLGRRGMDLRLDLGLCPGGSWLMR
mmetsp:Transcript_11620/g.18238  ORF Transcript_11620/g.18238 Transcript_11620/m.18238 type:complete len:253 (-) Transcript_11620:663-1421(-)